MNTKTKTDFTAYGPNASFGAHLGAFASKQEAQAYLESGKAGDFGAGAYVSADTKTDAQHTPGPWCNGQNFNGFTDDIHAPVNWGDPEARDSVKVATVNRGLPDWQANARLIAAAPELLAALERMLAVWPYGHTNDKTAAVIATRAAISKARGDA